jgi:hypothetical protein
MGYLKSQHCGITQTESNEEEEKYTKKHGSLTEGTT